MAYRLDWTKITKLVAVAVANKAARVAWKLGERRAIPMRRAARPYCGSSIRISQER
jgi:hypothetical protein